MGTGVKINGKHTETDYGLKLISIEIGIPETLSKREQIPGSNTYINNGNKGIFGQRPIALVFDRFGGYKDWMERISLISADINGQEIEIEMDSQLGYYYYGIATVSTTKENNVVTSFKINIQADPFKYKDYVSVSANVTASKTITVQGDYPVPCIIEIIPQVNVISSLTISGIARNKITGELEDILIKNLTKNNKIIIDGENGTVIEGSSNKFADTEFWEFPSLLPGGNEITFDNAQCNVTIKYRPRFI